MLILTHRSFMQFHDAYKQGAFRLIEMRNQLDNIISGRGFSFWSWYEGTGLDEPLEIFVDPFSFIGSLFPIRYLELGFTAAALLRMYFGGIAFLLLGRETGLTKRQNIVGATLYVFSACFIGLALRQSEFLVSAYLFPLLVLGAERIYKEKKPILFILVVAYYMLISSYLAYMSAIVIIVYICLRYFAYKEAFAALDYIKNLAGFIAYGLIGIMLSACGSIFSILATLRASTDSTFQTEGLFFNAKHYFRLGKILLGTGSTYDYLDIGLPILVILLIPIAIRGCTRKSTNTIMTILLLSMLFLPFFGSMFNGFSYVTFRWSYMLVFFAVWSAAEQLDKDKLSAKGAVSLLLTGLTIAAIWTAGLHLIGKISLDREELIFVVIQLAAGAFIIALLIWLRGKPSFDRIAASALIAISFISLSAGWAVGFRSNIDSFARNSSVYNNLQKSTIRVSNQIEDSGFYRVDSVDRISSHAEMKFPSNENIWWKSNNLFIYNSMIPKTLTEFNVELGNSYGYARRVYMISNGNRMGLDFLYGARYFLGNDAKKEGYEDSDYYAGYGFEKKGEIDGVTVFKNKYDVGLGFALDKVILKSEFDKLGRLEKEQALLQAAVVPDEEAEKCEGLSFVKASELDLDILELPYELTDLDGIRVEDGRLIADKEDASFVMNVKDVPECQLVISFDNLLLNSKDGIDGAAYEIYADDGRIKRYVHNHKSRQGVDGLKNHDINMGWLKGDDSIKITLSEEGVYTFDKIYASAMSVENYDKYAGECIGRKLSVDDYDDKKVEGRLTTDKDGVLFLSITASDNWDIYIDEEKAEKIEGLDTAFVGARIPKGEHSIELKYNNKSVRYGSIVSLIGVLLMIAISLKGRKTTA
ncbi:MAG: YfhO family protein [Mogibacterium sp.]|nr:YfhO family protein [Mogibacterium sp.]